MSDVTSGQVTRVDLLNQGTHLVGPALAGALVLEVDSVVAFNSTGGTLDLDGARLTYINRDLDASTITLAAPLALAAEEGLPVWVVLDGRLSVEYWATVNLDEPDAEPIEARLTTSMTGHLPEGTYSPPVPVELELIGGVWHVMRDTPGRAAVIHAEGSLSTFADGGFPYVRQSVVANAFENGQSWALTGYGVDPEWDEALIWGWHSGGATPSAALRLSSPFKADVSGDPFRRAAVLDLRADHLGTTTAKMYADDLILEGNSFTINSLDDRADVNIQGTSFLSLKRGTERVVFDWGTFGEVSIKARTDFVSSNARHKMRLFGAELVFDVASASELYVYAPAGVTNRPALGNFPSNNALVFGGGAPGQLRSMTWAGDIYLPMWASSFDVKSDVRDKTNVVPLDGATAMDAIRAMGGYVYDTPHGADAGCTVHRRGLIAQEVAGVAPEAVSVDEEGGMNVDIYGVTATITAALKHLDARVAAIERTTP